MTTRFCIYIIQSLEDGTISNLLQYARIVKASFLGAMSISKICLQPQLHTEQDMYSYQEMGVWMWEEGLSHQVLLNLVGLL